jgi:ankyrin repeat protein
MTSIIDLIKNKNIKQLVKVIKDDKNINLNVIDETYNYFIHYVLLYNETELIDLILERKIRLDILDTDGRTILYTPIKYSYNNLLKKLLDKDKDNIGLSIIDIKDKLGLTALHYSIIFNNYEAFKYLLNKNINYLSITNQNLNALHLCIQYKRYQFFIDLLNLITNLDFTTQNNETILQYSIINGSNNFTELILKKKININNQEEKNGLTALHQAILKDNIQIVKLLIVSGANINQQDFYGNTGLHYAISEDNKDIIKLLLSYNLNFDLTNIDGNTALHTYLELKTFDTDILSILITKTNLNIQNNMGITCLNLILREHLFENFKNILVNKELNFFIEDIYGIDMSDGLQDNDTMEIAIESYYNQIMNKGDKLFLDWEKWCSEKLIEKLKDLKKNSSDSKSICIEKIKEVIEEEKRSLPKYTKLDLILDNGIFVNTCYYTGVPLDILFGMVFLQDTFKKSGLSLVLDYPLTTNQNLQHYYEKIGVDFPFKLEFSNCEILWSFQKIFYPTYFDYEFDKVMNNTQIKYITIPLGIELQSGSHANILFIDKDKKTIERFEPNGSNFPIGLNYNPELLDDILLSKFSEYNLELLRPKDFLPSIGFQILENVEEEKCKRLGDPNGFCGVWCVWWVYHRMKNEQFDNKTLSIDLIAKLKMENKSFKNIIRNFSNNITEIRDKFLKKFNLDINDWMVGNIDDKIINNLEKEIFKFIS